MGTGTLYTMLGRLVEDKLIVIIQEEEGKKIYRITEDGYSFLLMEQRRLQQQYENGAKILREENVEYDKV